MKPTDQIEFFYVRLSLKSIQKLKLEVKCVYMPFKMLMERFNQKKMVELGKRKKK